MPIVAPEEMVCASPAKRGILVKTVKIGLSVSKASLMVALTATVIVHHAPTGLLGLCVSRTQRA